MARDKVLARIHILRKERGLDEDTYRDLIERITGQRSLKTVDTNGRKKVMLALQGNSPRKKSGKPIVRKVFALWADMCRRGSWKNSDRASLRAFVQRMTGVEDPEWMSVAQANVVIEALKNIDERYEAPKK